MQKKKSFTNFSSSANLLFGVEIDIGFFALGPVIDWDFSFSQSSGENSTKYFDFKSTFLLFFVKFTG